MKIIIPDDYQHAVRGLDAFTRLAGHDVRLYHDFGMDEDTLAERFQEADALVLIRERTPIRESLLARLPRLKYIAQTGRGVAHIDVPACTRRGVAVVYGGASPYATAELTWGLVLAAMRFIPQEVARLKAGQWQTTLGVGLRGRTLGVLGYGSIGSVVAGYGKAFGMRVFAWGRSGSLARAQADGCETAASQRDLFAQADVLCIHVKLSDETRGLIRPDDLAAMKPTAVLVNTSRAGLIVPGALEAALRAGRPGYAAVDVYEAEPALDHPLLRLDNAICTPHLGYVERDSYELYFRTAFDALLAVAAGQPTNVINPEALEK